MSVLGLAAAISRKMFETVYDAYPSALANAANDDISPLCVAAMKNDKDLFFKLLELGTSLSDASETSFFFFSHVYETNIRISDSTESSPEFLEVKSRLNRE